MLKIALITNFNISEKANTAMNVADRLLRGGAEVMVAAFNLHGGRGNPHQHPRRNGEFHIYSSLFNYFIGGIGRCQCNR